METNDLLQRLKDHIAYMAPHQTKRYAGKLLIEAEKVITVLDATNLALGSVIEKQAGEIKRLQQRVTHMEREREFGPDAAHGMKLREEDEARARTQFLLPPAGWQP